MQIPKELRKTILFSAVAGMMFFGAGLCINTLAALVGLAGMLAVFSVFFIFTMGRYKDIADLNLYIRKLSYENQPPDILDNKEGELGMLKTEIGKITGKLTYQAAYLDEEKQRMADALSDISHQMKTPLAAISIMADLLDSPDLPQEKQKEFLHNIKSAQRQMQWQVETLLKMAKLDAGAVVMQSRLCNIEDVIRRAGEPVSVLMELKGQHLRLENIAGSTVNCDANWTAEALGNIIKNCAEHTNEGGEIIVSQGDNPMYTWISVVGGGEGIPREDLPYIFKRFYKGKNARKDSTGIGLPMSLLILKKQNGDIEVENINGGVQFTLKFYKANTI